MRKATVYLKAILMDDGQVKHMAVHYQINPDVINTDKAYYYHLRVRYL